MALPARVRDQNTQADLDYLQRLAGTVRSETRTLREEITTLREENRALREELRRALRATESFERRPFQIGSSTIRVTRGPNTFRFRFARAWRTHAITICIPIAAESFSGITNYYGTNAEARECGLVINSSIEQNVTAAFISFGEV